MIKRTLFEPIKEHLSKKEITLITGPRQAGKTTLMLALKEHLKKKGQKTLFLNLDIEADRQYFSSQAKLLNKIKLEFGQKKAYIFIDEIQRKTNAGLFLKGIYDSNLPYKFIVSGSGSIKLKEKIHESLAGRKQVFDLTTLSFQEFLNYKTEYKYQDKLDQFCSVEPQKTNSFFQEYLSFGGYPRVVLSETLEEKQNIINDIYQSFLLKDISFLLNVKKLDAFSNLLRVLSSQIGQLTNISEISNTLNISVKTVNKYLWYLEHTFIISKITPYFKNTRKEITKSPIYYFSDLGLRNFINNNFDSPLPQPNSGFLFQNFYYLLINQTKSLGSRIHFWRTKNKAELDFIVIIGQELIPMEIKYKRLKNTSIPGSLKSFIKKYQPKKANIINLSLSKTIKINSTVVNFIPYYSLVR
ncbi:MAG: ATP-binding protein [Candidatus Beckwithbacteria bacterium]|nr:ATP-binding protein [Patescibacteria group bacterium]